ncbi:uncharacterized protein N7483_003511 [Penicillium malachiteum]|uniref:uncharacterized protein n=1 Tax=Penicillium malachiteum TaxID=1324776 RepID=UPI002548D566|nr:uncharacterized protein N7483_003511 [Penicillium malachiteum]KAJ5729003.1 hypothetical protein N7483_003511 [Penicillium malachiteum]
MSTLRQQDLITSTCVFTTNHTSMTKMRRELNPWILHPALNFRGEFFPFLYSCAEEMDFCTELCQGIGGDVAGWFLESWDWFEEDDWSETVG